MKRIAFGIGISILLGTSSAFAAQHSVNISASAGAICVLPEPSSSNTSLLSVNNQTSSDFSAQIDTATGKVQPSSATLTFEGAYCNIASNIALSSGNAGGGLTPGVPVPSGFAASVDYFATANWGSVTGLTLTPIEPEVNNTSDPHTGDLTVDIAVSNTDLPIMNAPYSDALTISITQN